MKTKSKKYLWACSDDKLRIDIAKLVGWNRPANVVNEFWDMANPFEFCPPGAMLYYANTKTIPDYVHDLNAIQEIILKESSLDKKWYKKYLRNLSIVILWDKGEIIGYGSKWDIHVATARQRALAYILTKEV